MNHSAAVPGAAWVTGDTLGQLLPANAAALRAGGTEFLSNAFHASGALAGNNRVSRITQLQEFHGGGTGSKLLLSVNYERPTPDLPTDLFVKFSRNFADPVRDYARYHMESEIRFAALSRSPAFPIAVPTCLYADFHRESGTGVLITQRIAYGTGAIEPHYPKCLDTSMPQPVAHYRALIKAIARLAGTHKAGRLPDDVEEKFPFDADLALSRDCIPYSAQRLQNRVARYSAFAMQYPQLLPGNITTPAFRTEFAQWATLFLQHERTIKQFLHGRSGFIALCHWNANVDNAWFWRNEHAELECGLMDWGSVGQMHVAMTIWGCLSGAETGMWNQHFDALLTLFVAEYHAGGGPLIDPGELKVHLVLYVALMGLAYLMDAPPQILAEVPDLADCHSPLDSRITRSETARTQLLMMTNFLSLCQSADLPALLDRLVRTNDV